MEKEVIQMPGYLQDSRDKKNSENTTEEKKKKNNNKSQFHIRRNFWTAWKAAEEISLRIPNSAQFWLLDKSHKQAG